MIDLHSHVLPGVDGGAQNLEDSLEMVRKAISQGITHLMCTPITTTENITIQQARSFNRWKLCKMKLISGD